jgi:micrococcal nuclease
VRRLLLLLLLLLTGCAAPAAPGPLTAPDPAMPLPSGAQEAVVVRHTDGDTLRLKAVHPGTPLRSSATTKVRLLEIDAPESVKPHTPVQCYALKASARLSQLAPVGAHVWVTADQDLKDRYGRTLLYLWDAHGSSINLDLVTGGYAKALYVRPNDRYLAVIDAAETRARQGRVGLWGAC